MVKSVFISSTSLDLADYRAAVDAALRRLELRPINMQDFGSQHGGASGVSLREVAKGNIFIGIIARRYGHVPEGSEKSIAEQEYDEAVRLNKPRLMYLLDPDAPWDDALVEQGETAQTRLTAFRTRIEQNEVRSLFTTPDDLARQVTTDVVKLLDKQRRAQTFTRILAALVAIIALIALVLVADPGIRSDVIEIAGLASATPTPTPTPTPTATPTNTATPTPTPTATNTPTITPTPLEGTAFAEGVIGVVLADFSDLDASDRAIERRIERAFEDEGVNFIRVRRPLLSETDAQDVADLYQATITIYGESQSEGIEVLYKITPRRSRVETRVENIAVTADLLNFSTYIFEGVDALYVVDFVRGQLAYFEHRYGDALTFFEAALERLPEDRQDELGASSLYFYTARSLQDNTTETNPRPRLERAIDLYRLALSFLDTDRPDDDYRFATTQNNLGVAYRNLADLTEPEANLRLALAAYDEALRFRTADSAPLDYAQTQNNLGVAYVDLAEVTEPEANLRLAIAAYDEALRFRTAAAAPLNYATTQSNLGNAYTDLAGLTEPEANLRLAIAAYDEALRFRTAAAAPLDYATTQNNLGVAYRNLADLTEPEANLHLAIAVFDEALRFRTADAAPLDYATTQNNLGVAYVDLAEVTEPEANLRLAIAVFDEALRFRTADAAPLDYATTQNNLGVAYVDLAEVTEPEANLRLALAAFDEALRFRTADAAPLDYATTQNNLGNAYTDLAGLTEPKANLRLAIAAYDEALRFRTADAAPLDYATTQNNLGNAYTDLAELTEMEANLRLALAAFDEALRFLTADAAPLDYATTITNLGITQYLSHDTDAACANWREAVEIYSRARITARVDAIQGVIDQLCPDPNITPIPTATPGGARSAQPGVQSGQLVVGGGDAWTYAARRGEALVIQVEAANPAGVQTTREERLEHDLFDTRVLIYTPDGTLLAENDDDESIAEDLPERTNSRLEITLPEKGVYTIIVRSYADTSGGNYTLTIQTAEPEE